MKNYIELMRKIIREGVKKDDTLSLFGETLNFDLREGFPIVTTRDINYYASFAELACFVRGLTDVKEFNQMGVKFWDHDCYKESWSNNPNKKHKDDLGKIYGYQWTTGFGFNQLTTLIENIKNKPTSRRHILTTFNPADLDSMCLPPCYVSHQFYSVDGYLDMLVHQRSADFCIGVPFDLVSFATFQELMAKETGLRVRNMKVIFGDVHIYEAHFPGVVEQLRRPLLDSTAAKPRLHIDPNVGLFNFTKEDLKIMNYPIVEKINYPFQVQN